MEIEPGDHVDKELTVFFTDIRSYTKIAETMSSVEIFNFINRYLGIAVKVIVKNNGFIDKFIGDAIMGLFSESPDDALLAVIELFEELKQYNSQPGVIPIQIGAGIHYGAVTMGTVGTEQRMDTTVIGDAVNFAARLENATKIYGKSVLISEAVYDKLKNPDRFNIREIDTVKVKGKNVPIKIYEVFDFDDSTLKAGKLSMAKLFNEGLLLYKAGSFAEADLKFKECKEICPGDELLAIYIKRCATLLRIPPGEDWCGVSGI
jgi:class 3 adenylate cyclase